VKKWLFGIGLLVLFFVISGPASAGQFGPTELTAQAGKFSFGVGYFFEDTKWEGPTLFEHEWDIRTESHQGYLQGSYGITKDWEVYGRLGAGDVKFNDKDMDELRDSAKIFGSLGFKGVMYSYRMFSLSLFGQGTLYSDCKDSISGRPVTGDLELKDYYNLNAGLSGQLKHKDFAIYGGPFWYYSRAKLDVSVNVPGSLISDSGGVESKHNMGGFLGVSIPLDTRVRLNFEGQLRHSISYGALVSISL
jgi:hypothetical protein